MATTRKVLNTLKKAGFKKSGDYKAGNVGKQNYYETSEGFEVKRAVDKEKVEYVENTVEVTYRGGTPGYLRNVKTYNDLGTLQEYERVLQEAGFETEINKEGLWVK
jgi:hypothetical protein